MALRITRIELVIWGKAGMVAGGLVARGLAFKGISSMFGGNKILIVTDINNV